MRKLTFMEVSSNDLPAPFQQGNGTKDWTYLYPSTSPKVLKTLGELLP